MLVYIEYEKYEEELDNEETESSYEYDCIYEEESYDYSDDEDSYYL